MVNRSLQLFGRDHSSTTRCALVGVALASAIGCAAAGVPEVGGDGIPVLVADADELERRIDTDPHRWASIATMASDAPFARVGFRFDAEDGAAIEVRADGGSGFGEWLVPQTTYRDGTVHNAFVDVPPASTTVEVRARAPRPDALTFLAMELIESAPDPIDSDVASTRGALVTGEPGLAANDLAVSRAEWGARPSLCPSHWRHTPRKVTIHHTVTPQDDPISMERRMRGIQAYHMDVRGWCDIAYHFLIGQDGKVYQGVHELWWGNHTGGDNPTNIGISFIGTFNGESPSAAMMDAAAQVLANLHNVHGVPLDRATVRGHRERLATQCPGDRLNPLIGDLVIRATDIAAGTDPCGSLSDGDHCAGNRRLSCSGGLTTEAQTCDHGCGDGECREASCHSARLGRDVESGECVQVSYASCGTSRCGWWACSNGEWTCSDASSCTGEQHPEPSCAPRQCYSNRLGRNIDSGSCIQVTYASCGAERCGWWTCADGHWGCADLATCGGETYSEPTCGGS